MMVLFIVLILLLIMFFVCGLCAVAGVSDDEMENVFENWRSDR